MARKAGALARTWRWFSGHALDGQHRTNATWTLPSHGPRPVLHPTGHAVRWHHMPRLHRAGIRTGSTLAACAVAAGLILAWALTAAVLAVLAACIAGYCAWRAWRWLRAWRRAWTWDREQPWRSAWEGAALPVTHYRDFRRPLKRALTEVTGAPPRRLAIAPDRSRVTIRLATGFTGADKQKEDIARAMTTKLALEAPEVTWRLHGHSPRVTFTLCDPPPKAVTWDDLAADIASAKPDELLSGAGKRSSIIRVSIKLDSPHFGIIAGTGGGKSTLAAFWLLQAVRRGDIVLILDAKRFSHPWTFKDMDAEYDQLPNVAYCRTVSDLHDAMCWLGGELDRRNAVAERTINAKGDVLGDVGPRMWIIAEEMNLAYGPLKQHWAAIRDPDDPKKSPAFTGLGAVSFAGRAVKMHLVPIGQMLKADILGGGDVRENIGVRMLTRYSANSWKMQAGDIPMPPPPSNPGRWQQLASGEVNEVQVPLIDMAQARDLAVGGIVTSCPAGMPGRADIPVVPSPAPSYGGSDLRVVLGQAVEVTVGLTIREAVDDGIFGAAGLEAARKRVQRARVEPSGQRGDGSYTYSRADLFAAARQARRKELAS